MYIDLFLACTLSDLRDCGKRVTCYVVQVLLFILLFFNDWKFSKQTRPQSDLTDKDILPLPDKVQLHLYTCQL